MAISFRWSVMEGATEGGMPRSSSLIRLRCREENFLSGCMLHHDARAKTAQQSGYPAKRISDLIIFTPPTSFFKADHNLVKLNDLNKENLYHCII